MEEMFAIIGLFTLPLSIGFAVAWWNARKELRLRREIALELGIRPQPQPQIQRPPQDSQRLEETIETLALEVERLAEGQRFVARLLSERGSHERASHDHPRERPASPNVITPH